MTVLRIYPAPQQKMSLKGLYLPLRLHRRAKSGEVFIYANFIASLDGRISLPDAKGEQEVPTSLANKRDWRLYQELAAQSDIMLTSARYFRQLAKGNAQDLLPVGSEPEYNDLAAWRLDEGLKSQPDVAILSRSLDIPQAALEKVQDRRVLVLTGEEASQQQVDRLIGLGVEVVRGAGQIKGSDVRRLLAAGGYRSAYMIAGPEVHRTLLEGGLDMLFLTQRHRLLGGDDFRSILQGKLDKAVDVQLRSMYLDEQSCLGECGGQSFASYTIQS
jgi:riboflavin biosynthesis pyrimidine reductase